MSQVPPIPPPIPQPVQVLSYNEYAGVGRPGAISAMGVLSITFGSIGLITTAFSALMYLGFMMGASATATMANLQTSDFAGPSGFYQVDRMIIVRAFATKQKMTPLQESQLAYLLSDVGTKILPAVGSNSATGNPIYDYTTKNLTGESGVGVEDGGVWYEVPSGRITVTDAEAAFTPNGDSSLPALNRIANRKGVNPAKPETLSAEEIQTIINRVQEIAAASPLNSQQIAALQKNLQSSPDVFIGSQPDMPSILSQISTVVPTGRGGQSIQFAHANLAISTTGGTAWTSTSGLQASPFGQMRVWPLAVGMTTSILSVLLCLYLIVIGIVTLRNYHGGGKLHRIYAWIKIVLTLVGGLGMWLIVADFSQGIINASPTPNAGVNNSYLAISGAWTAGAVAIGLAYPVAILLILRSKSVKAFYAPVTV